MKAILTSLMLYATITAAAQSLAGTWKGTLKVGPQELTMVLHIDRDKGTVGMDVVEQGANGIPMKVVALTDDSLSVRLDQLNLTYAGRLKDGKLEGTFRQMGFTAPLTLEPGEPTFSRPQEPQPPYPYTTEEVAFANKAAGAVLAGTLTYPTGYKKGMRVPVVLMITGSGAQNRDEEMLRHKPFLVLADYLARHGIASLRYDDRGTAASTGHFDTATTRDFADDARCGLDYLRASKTFSKVGIVGHSEGGIIAYMLGSEHHPDFIVSMAGPACRIDTLMAMQLNALAKAQGAPGPIVHNAAEARQLLLMQQDTPWMRQFVDTDVAPFVRATTCPVLALGGEADLNVPPTLNTPALQTALAHNPNATIKVYPGLSHLFHHNPTGNPRRAANIEETLAPEVMDDIAAWINGR